jgi:hypothetical protein
MDSRTFDVSEDEIPNPERGFYQLIDLANVRDFRFLRAKGWTLGLASVSLAAYRNSELSREFLDRLTEGFNAARASGIKIILRFKYAHHQGAEDASRERILGHLAQLAPLLQANSDVIAIVQAGFIGAWGEWHSSTNGLDNPTDRGELLRALLQALPSDRFIQVRRPLFKREFLGSAPLGPGEAWGGSWSSRIGHHNDAFLAGRTDMGTYVEPVDEELSYVALESRYVPMGGECDLLNPPRSSGANAVLEMKRLHYTYLNGEFLRAVLDEWAREGRLSEIRDHLGYRMSLLDATWTSAVRPGGVLEVSLHLRNSGYAAPFNRRPVYIVLANDTRREAARIDSTDVRKWVPGDDFWLRVKLRVPATLPRDRFRLSLWLPDASLSLQSKADYAIRLANLGVWDPKSGYNQVTDSLQVDPSAPGERDPSASALVELR